MKLRQWIKKYFSWIVIGLFGFQVYMVYAANADLIPTKNYLFFRLFIVLVLPIIYLLLLLINWKNVTSKQIPFLTFIFAVESSFIINYCFEKMGISDSAPILTLWVAVIGLGLSFYGYMQMKQKTVIGAILDFVSTGILLIMIGLFKQSWWTLVPLTAAVLTFIFSKEWFLVISDTEITEKDIPFILKRKWAKMKFQVLMISLMFYPTIAFSDVLEDYGAVRWMCKVFFNKASDKEILPLEHFFSKGYLRFFVAILLFIVVYVLYLFRNKSSHYSNLMQDYEQVVEKKKMKIKREAEDV